MKVSVQKKPLCQKIESIIIPSYQDPHAAHLWNGYKIVDHNVRLRPVGNDWNIASSYLFWQTDLGSCLLTGLKRVGHWFQVRWKLEKASDSVLVFVTLQQLYLMPFIFAIRMVFVPEL